MEDNEEEEKSSRTIELKNLLKKTEDEEESKKEHSISSPKHSNLKKVLISGVGFFSDAYDLFIINIVMLILFDIYGGSSETEAFISSAALAGAIGGQLIFGFLADRIGRKKGFVVTLSLVSFGALASSLSFHTATNSIYVSLCFFRFLLGFGIGGEYPLSATITSESAETTSRGRLTALVFSMQGLGSFVAALSGYFFITSFKEENLELAWRFCLGFGALPGIFTLHYRIKMHETERFQHRRHNVSYGFVLKKYWKTILGTAGSWFLFDVVFYSNGLFSSTILELYQVGKPEHTFQQLVTTSKLNILLTLISLPGYWVGIFLIEIPQFGRKNTQMIGFLALGTTYILIASIFETLLLLPGLFIFLYGLTFFFANAGPNTTTFVIPSETFPTEVRATCHGLSAAAGKLGAVIGASMMAPILQSGGIPSVLYICGGISFLGSILTWFCVHETRGIILGTTYKSN